MTAPRHVLVVTDDVETRDALCAVLEPERYVVVTAASGLEGLDRLSSEPPPSVMLLDLMMDGMDGWTLLGKCRDGATPIGVPVIVMSAHGGMSRAAPYLGAAALVAKPVDPAELLSAVRQFARIEK